MWVSQTLLRAVRVGSKVQEGRAEGLRRKVSGRRGCDVGVRGQTGLPDGAFVAEEGPDPGLG